MAIGNCLPYHWELLKKDRIHRISLLIRQSFFVFSKTILKTYKMDLDLWGCLGGVKLILYQNFIGLI